jgi:hypothetical protein
MKSVSIAHFSRGLRRTSRFASLQRPSRLIHSIDDDAGLCEQLTISCESNAGQSLISRGMCLCLEMLRSAI